VRFCGTCVGQFIIIFFSPPLPPPLTPTPTSPPSPSQMNKVPKARAAALFKYVKSINVSFNPSATTRLADTRSAREFLTQIQSKKIAISNPRLIIETDVHARADRPQLDIAFVDDQGLGGENLKLTTDEMVVDTIRAELFQRCMAIEQDYDLKGKTVD